MAFQSTLVANSVSAVTIGQKRAPCDSFSISFFWTASNLGLNSANVAPSDKC